MPAGAASSTRRTLAPAAGRRAPLRAVDDRHLVSELLGPAVAGRVAHVPVAVLLDADGRRLAGLGLPRASRRRLLAAGELARRFQPDPGPPEPRCDRPEQFLPHLAALRAADVEVLAVACLDARLRLLGDPCPVAAGGLMHVAVSAREVFAPAIVRRATSVVLAHNHPSGDARPSDEDLGFTDLMSRAGELLGIRVLDHLVVTRRGYFSFAASGLLPSDGGRDAISR